jgi:hypothetical protein
VRLLATGDIQKNDPNDDRSVAIYVNTPASCPSARASASVQARCLSSISSVATADNPSRRLGPDLGRQRHNDLSRAEPGPAAIRVTEREREIAVLVGAPGRTSRPACSYRRARLGITFNHAYIKLGVTDRQEPAAALGADPAPE